MIRPGLLLLLLAFIMPSVHAEQNTSGFASFLDRLARTQPTDCSDAQLRSFYRSVGQAHDLVVHIKQGFERGVCDRKPAIEERFNQIERSFVRYPLFSLCSSGSAGHAGDHAGIQLRKMRTSLAEYKDFLAAHMASELTTPAHEGTSHGAVQRMLTADELIFIQTIHQFCTLMYADILREQYLDRLEYHTAQLDLILSRPLITFLVTAGGILVYAGSRNDRLHTINYIAAVAIGLCASFCAFATEC